MSQTQRDKPTQPATVRAEELFDRMEERIGYFTSLAIQRIQRTITSIREEADRLDQPNPTPAEQSNGTAVAQTEEAGQPTAAKAEEMVDRMGQRINQYTTRAGLQIQRAVARVREEAEDMWAEAENIRRQNGRKPQ